MPVGSASNMTSISTLSEIGTNLGLSGQELLSFIKDQQDKERDERRAEREYNLKRAELGAIHNDSSVPTVSFPPIPSLTDSDDLPSYFIRFERQAEMRKWNKVHWALQLGCLLTGKALSVFSSLPSDITENYDNLKRELLQYFQYTSEYHRKRFRTVKRSNEESYTQFGFNLMALLDSWLVSCDITQDYDNLKDFILMDQFMSSCSPEMRIFIKEHECKSLQDMCQKADIFVEARVGNSKTNDRAPPNSFPARNSSDVRCNACGVLGHIKAKCPQNPASFNRTKYDHKVEFALNNNTRPGELVSGTINGASVSSILRDTGCSCFIVSDKLIPDKAEIIKYQTISDYLGRTDRFPVVKCYINCPYYDGWIEAVKAPIKFCALLVGNEVDKLNLTKVLNADVNNTSSFSRYPNKDSCYEPMM